MRNLRDRVRRRDQARIKRDAQRTYLARDASQARRAFARFRFHWQAQYSGLVRRLERDLPELLTFFDFPQPLWRKLRTTNAIERCFVEVRRRTRPMVLFTNMQSVERIASSGRPAQISWPGACALRIFSSVAMHGIGH
jgi:transposase-like protein